MSLLFMEGFDNLNVSSDIGSFTDMVTPHGAPSFSTSVRGPAGKCLKIPNDGVGVRASFANQNGNTIIIGFAFKKSTEDTVENTQAAIILHIQDTASISSSSQCYLKLTTAPCKFQLWRDNSIVATGVTTIIPGVWYYCELKIKVHSSTGLAELKINELTTDFSVTNVNTQRNATADVNYCSFGYTANGYNVFFDDIYIFNTSGAINNTYFGDCSILPFVADGDDAVTWTATGGGTHFNQVNEALYNSDGVTTMISSNVNGNEDSFTMANVSDVGAVGGVKLNVIADKSDTGGKTFEMGVYSGANRQAIGKTPGIAFGPHVAYFEDSDGAGTVWDSTKINAMKTLVKVTS